MANSRKRNKALLKRVRKFFPNQEERCRGSCIRKKPYAYEALAMQAVEAYKPWMSEEKQKRISHYFCWFCSNYHVGKRGKKK